MKKNIFILLFCVTTCMAVAQNDRKPKVYMVSNAHFDTQWNWTVQTSISDYLRNTLEQNLWLLEQYPDYIFNFEGGIRYLWMKEYYPYHYEQVKKYVKDGRWNLSGASWDSSDPNIPSVESAFRNILLGQQFFKTEFGKESDDMFMPDCFGFGYATPTVAAHCDLLGFSTQKLAKRRVVPFTDGKNFPFRVGLWEGIDGNRICAVFDGEFYMKKWQGNVANDKDLLQLAKESVNGNVYRYYGTGDIGGAPNPISVHAVQEAAKDKNGKLEVINATSDQLYKDYLPFSDHPELPIFKGELLLEMHAAGCYTSQGAMKRYNRRNEQLGDAAERASVVASLLGGYEYPREKLTEAWRRFLWHQFHDDLTGTSIPEAYTFSWNDELISQSQFADIITAAVGSVSNRLNTDVKGTPLVVYNPLGCEHNDLVHAFVSTPKRPAEISVYSPNGKKIPSQILSWQEGQAEIAFSAQVAPLSFNVFDVRFSGSSSSRIKVGKNSIENSIYKVTLNSHGDISSIIDKRYDRELVEKNKSFRLAAIEGNLSEKNPAWDITWETLQTPSVGLNEQAKISVAYCGQAAGALKIERKYKESEIVQYVQLTNGVEDDRIDIITELDWASKNVLFKAEFPMSVSNPKAMYDLGLGHIERGNNHAGSYEVVAQQWASISQPDNSYGITIANNCKYGWDKPNDNTLRLTLMHSPQVGSGPKDKFIYQERQDFGKHSITYSVIGHKGSAPKSDVSRKADRLNNPLFVFTTDKHFGNLGRNFSMVKLSSPDIDLKTLKMAEDGRDMVIARFYQPTGKQVKDAFAEFALPIKDAYHLNGVEKIKQESQSEGKRLMIDASAFAPRTYGIEMVGETAEKPKNKYVQLQYTNTFAIPDGYRGDKYSVNFDGEGNSYSANVLPSVVCSEGVEFKLGDIALKSAVRCDGQQIKIDAQGKMVYLLVASSAEDKKASFTLGEDQFSFMIPSWSGFFGQWGHDGAPTYVKDGTLAYIGSHIHNKQSGAVPYVFSYMYKIAIPLDNRSTTLTLPSDKDIVVFAITVSDITNHTEPANEFRAI